MRRRSEEICDSESAGPRSRRTSSLQQQQLMRRASRAQLMALPQAPPPARYEAPAPPPEDDHPGGKVDVLVYREKRISSRKASAIDGIEWCRVNGAVAQSAAGGCDELCKVDEGASG